MSRRVAVSEEHTGLCGEDVAAVRFVHNGKRLLVEMVVVPGEWEMLERGDAGDVDEVVSFVAEHGIGWMVTDGDAWEHEAAVRLCSDYVRRDAFHLSSKFETWCGRG